MLLSQAPAGSAARSASASRSSLPAASRRSSILKHLDAVHARYGDVIREAKVGEGDSPAVREKLSTLGDAIRLYIIRVAGSVDRRHPETQVLADELRKPFAEWKTKHSRAVSPKAEKPADAPAAALEEKSKAHQ